MTRKVLLTGASGSMGHAAFLELLGRRDEYDIVLLLRPSKKNKDAFREYEGDKSLAVGGTGVVEHDGIKIVWGDLTAYQDVLEAVNGVDFVLHPAAFISPAADHNPALARRINHGGTVNIINAIKAQPNNGDGVKFVFIGSVAAYGDRLPPIHRIRTGDPLMPSVYDFYATTKIAAERAVIESGLKYWVSIRQTYIAIPDTLSLIDPIMFHQPIHQRIEFVTDRDAGYGLVQCLEAPDDFWRRIYNMGGGPSCRFVYLEDIERSMKLAGLRDYRKLMERNWFALRNFHCGYFEDGHVLNEYLGHWRDTLDDHYRQVLDALPWYAKLARFVPKSWIKRYMKRMADPLIWNNSPEKYAGRITAFLGSREAWEAIPDWDVDMPDFDAEGHLLEHGYTAREDHAYSIQDMREAAEFRGGECLSAAFVDMSTGLKWRCAFGHEFDASPTLILLGGHWCPVCAAPGWDYDRIAQVNPFLAQAYYNTHSKDETNCYSEQECLADLLPDTFTQ